MPSYNLCLMGFGNVGRALARLLQIKTPELHDRYDINWQITGVATRRMGWLADPDGLDVPALLDGKQVSTFTPAPTNVREWLAAAHADVMFEITSVNAQTGQPGIDHVRAALESGAHAITANKGIVVHGYRQLRELAAANGRRFFHEATVIGGAPIFSLFRETLPAARLLRFRGILNSTTNIILGQMEAGRSFDEAVKIAQDMGNAETDPSADIDGWDAAVKVVSLVTVLMDTPLKLDDIVRQGIRGLTGETVRAARAAGMPYKLVCRAERFASGHVVASVCPEQVSLDDPLASVNGRTLTIHFEMDTLHGLTVTEHGAGPDTTAYGLLADFVNAVRA